METSRCSRYLPPPRRQVCLLVSPILPAAPRILKHNDEQDCNSSSTCSNLKLSTPRKHHLPPDSSPSLPMPKRQKLEISGSTFVKNSENQESLISSSSSSQMGSRILKFKKRPPSLRQRQSPPDSPFSSRVEQQKTEISGTVAKHQRQDYCISTCGGTQFKQPTRRQQLPHSPLLPRAKQQEEEMNDGSILKHKKQQSFSTCGGGTSSPRIKLPTGRHQSPSLPMVEQQNPAPNDTLLKHKKPQLQCSSGSDTTLSDNNTTNKTKKVDKYRELTLNWFPSPVQQYSADVGDDEWLFGSYMKEPKVTGGVCGDRSDDKCSSSLPEALGCPSQGLENTKKEAEFDNAQNSTSYQPRAIYLPEFDIWQMPCVVPF